MCKINNNSVEEEWKDIIGFEGLYQVSNLGRIKSLRDNHNNPREKILKPQLTKGYYWISLWKNGKRKMYLIHRLVALAFIPNPMNLPQVNHIDENKTNNCADNLEWCDCKYNINFGNRNKLAGDKLKDIFLNREDCSKPILQLDLDGNIVNEYPSIHEAERQTGFKNQNICNCLKGKRKTCGGFIWKYKTKNGED